MDTEMISSDKSSVPNHHLHIAILDLDLISSFIVISTSIICNYYMDQLQAICVGFICKYEL